MAFSVSASRSELAEINITPLVDVMLVLLVIFMVTAPMLSRPIQVALPQPGPTPTTAPPNDLVLRIGVAGDYTLDDRAIPAAELRAYLEEARVSDPDTILWVESAEGAEYQQVVTALATAEASGLRNISLRD